MSHADIEKWISGEIEVFDPHQIALPSALDGPFSFAYGRFCFVAAAPTGHTTGPARISI
jgi:hypothetical protein